MLKVKIEGEVYKFPKGWKDITIKKYISFEELIAKYGEDALKEFNEAKDPSDFILFCADVVSFWGDIPKEEINKCDVNDIYKAFNELSKYFELPSIDEDFKSFTYKGTEYILPEKNMEGSTLIEFLESMQLEKATEELAGGSWNALPKVIGILARPQGEEYDSKRLELRSQMFMNLDMEIVSNVAFFLTKRSNSLLKSLQFSLEEEVQISSFSKLVEKTSMLVMVGISRLNKWLKVVYSTLVVTRH